jgi:hypothetical protein
MSKQLLKGGSTKNDHAGVTKARRLSNISGSRNTSKATGCRSSLIQRLKNVIEPLTKLGKGKTTFRKTQKLVYAPGQPNDITSEKPRAAYPDLEKPPETETGATICAIPSTEDRRAQAEAIGSHSRKHPLKGNPHKAAT